LYRQLLMCVLEGILPAPAAGIPARELAGFKERYAGLLPRFRRRVETFLIEASQIPDKNLADYRIRLFKDELQDEIEEIEARMHERRWPRVVFGTLCGVFAAAVPGIQAVATGDATPALTALPGLVCAIYSAFKESPIQKEILRSPLAYAALARERLG